MLLFLWGGAKADEDDMTDDARVYRKGKLEIFWASDGLGRVSLDGEHWASVEWSEKRQAWCIEDVSKAGASRIPPQSAARPRARRKRSRWPRR
jgi:hypothetical protein